jgi:L-histidine Nalpha-methyltransferase
MSVPTPLIDVCARDDELTSQLAHDVEIGLQRIPKTLPPKWFYDTRGSELFDEITRLPEYYPTRCERTILHRRATKISRTCRADTLIELGSGTADKTRVVLDAMHREGFLQRFSPFDVSESTLRASAHELADRYEIEVHGVVGDFTRHLDHLPSGGRRLVAFLGGTIGNLTPPARREFFLALSMHLHPLDGLLLGTDLIKDPERLVRAYDDEQGVTAQFNRNVLDVINRELHADFDVERFAHEARWRDDQERIEMHLVSRGRQSVTIPSCTDQIQFADGESILTEISCKFRREAIEAELDAAGFELAEWWTDPDDDYAVSLSFKR